MAEQSIPRKLKSYPKKDGLTADELRAQIFYDPETGEFWRKVKVKKGKRSPYVDITVNNITYKGHRLAWLWMTGKWPEKLIDHINRKPGDNRWANLREASYQENGRNRKTRFDNVTGYKGVTYYRHTKKWGAYIDTRENGKPKRLFLGVFDTKELAYQARCALLPQYHGEFSAP